MVGMHDMKQKYGSPERHVIERIDRHASYNNGRGNTANDIAMIKLKEPITFNSHVKAITIDSEGEFDDGADECVISGWGYMIEGRYFVNPTVLQEAHTTILTNSACQNTWGRSAIAGGHVCIKNGKTGACMGDSGGPLACRNGSGDWHLVGATSWGSGSCNVGYPSVYTRLSYFKNWIQKTSGL